MQLQKVNSRKAQTEIQNAAKKFGWKNKKITIYSNFTVIAIGCPTGTSFEPSGTNIFAKNLHVVVKDIIPRKRRAIKGHCKEKKKIGVKTIMQIKNVS